MKKSLIIALFSCLILIQIAIPLSMIAKREIVLKEGRQFKFKTEPVDPYDAFRGRYVALRVAEDKIPLPKNGTFKKDQMVFAQILVGEDGFARISDLKSRRPHGTPYITARVNFVGADTVSLSLPFDRYYMEEKKAPIAEKLYRQHASREKQDAYISVRIKDGFAVIEKLYVGGMPIEEALKR